MAKSVALICLGPLLIAACTSSSGSTNDTGDAGTKPPSDTSGDPLPVLIALDIRHTGGTVNGSDFQCEGTWPGVWNPCAYGWTSQPIAFAALESSDMLKLSFIRQPIPVDGGASVVELKLHFDASGALTEATAETRTTQAGTVRTLEDIGAVSGWIDPVAVGSSPDQRNAGRFSLTFTWGSITGTYDTNLPSP